MGFKNGKGFSRRIAFAVLQQMAAFATKDGKYGRFMEVLAGTMAMHLAGQPAAKQASIVADIVARADKARAAVDAAQALETTLSVDGSADDLQAVAPDAAALIAKWASNSKEV